MEKKLFSSACSVVGCNTSATLVAGSTTGQRLCDQHARSAAVPLESPKQTLVGKRIVIGSTTHAYGSPVSALFLEALLEMRQNDHAFDDISVNHSDTVHFISVDTEVVGFLAWSVQEWNQTANVALGYVKPAWRRLGLYQRLVKALETECQHLSLRAIERTTRTNNTALRAVAEQAGYTLYAVTYRKEFEFHPKVISDTYDDKLP